MAGIKRITDLFNEHHEIAAWIVIMASFALLFFEKLDQWPFIAMLSLGLMTLLGSGYYGAKFKVGPSGVEMDASKDQ